MWRARRWHTIFAPRTRRWRRAWSIALGGHFWRAPCQGAPWGMPSRSLVGQRQLGHQPVNRRKQTLTDTTEGHGEKSGSFFFLILKFKFLFASNKFLLIFSNFLTLIFQCKMHRLSSVSWSRNTNGTARTVPSTFIWSRSFLTWLLYEVQNWYCWKVGPLSFGSARPTTPGSRTQAGAGLEFAVGNVFRSKLTRMLVGAHSESTSGPSWAILARLNFM